MARAHILPVLAVMLLLAVQAQGLFFYLKEGQNKCFIEDLPASTLVVGEFSASDIQAGRADDDIQPRKEAFATPLGLKVTVKEPDGGVLVDNQYPATGRVAFTSRIAGEHIVCFKTDSSRWFGAGAVKMELDLQTGADAQNDYDDIKQMEQLTELEVSVRRLNDRVVELRRGQSYFRNREELLRNSSELANTNVMWFSFLQTLILVVSGVWQIQHLKGFFKAKKMV
mmetsp:Transcript_15236/g.59578  ORF Transcript_15236/g.59578 Transcript_15236/m.59578 type:complete len:226 (-) Transcript_15236:42-719(-)|eukprot:CAMPEP_0114613762 /NCGR_PEP_ID=MMETSP0168-20121206/5301_1 /TAXON_ID=95228 ORGANISM="Vannella sp., Strain DIVA3 517/6/12" /NCGR_SAMPLE_ID=MMETSP0168 /ASSEMBLY_ACC=CAM_ASM_000044 /LENGTH=225 /DNA_ID=CAMNT_0001824781 /DNA_START=79 /DNA_END=756 /DNA_ORIENTATION=+